MARGTFYLLGAGGLVGLLSLTLRGVAGENDAPFGTACLLALGLAAVALVGFDGLPEPFFRAAPATATLLITSDLLFSGHERTSSPFFFFVVVLFAFNFLPVRAAVLQLALIGVAEVVVAASRPTVLSPDNAVLILAVLTGSAYVVVLTNSRLRDLLAELARSRRAVRRSREETVHRLERAAEFRDEETGLHTKRMGEYCFVLARQLGLGLERGDLIRIAAPLHDLGKIAIPDRILLKPGPLTPSETAIMQDHTEVGFQLLTGSGQRMLDLAASIALTHHEHFDGSGYPRSLLGSEIPIEGRIAAVADVFDALTSDRPYRSRISIEDAVERIRARSGTQFDPDVVAAFLSTLGEILEIRERHSTEKRLSLEAFAVA